MKKKYKYFIIIFLAVAVFIAFGRISGNSFINYDDVSYITHNNHIKSGINPESIKWAFSTVVVSNWHPLTLLSHILDWNLFGENPSGHHFMNLLLHIGAVIFLFLFLNKTTNHIWSSAFVAALFALHPLRVESVAWAAERKDVLSMFFGLAGIYAYVLYAESSKRSRYFFCLILFALSLISKPTLVTLPFVLLLVDYWPLGRWQKASTPVNAPVPVNEKASKKKNKQRKADCTQEKKLSTPLMNRFSANSFLLWEKAPFIFLTIISCIVTVWAQNKGGAFIYMDHLSFPERVQNAIISYVSYSGKIFWPVNLAVFYPYEYPSALWQVFVSCFTLTGITIAVIYACKKLPFLFVGWFWYLGTLIPVIGLVQIGEQAMADRYTYLPSIGIAIMLGWGIPLLFPREDIRKKILFPAGIAVLAILAVLTRQQCGYWKNSIELFSHAVQITRDNYQAHNHLGYALVTEGKIGEAIDHYNKAIGIRPDSAVDYSNLGVVYAQLGQHQHAIEDYNYAIRLKPDYAAAYFNRGNLYSELGQFLQAIADYSEAIHLKPDYLEAYNNRGNAYLSQGNSDLGCYDAQKVCEWGDCRLLEMAKGKGNCGAVEKPHD